MDFINFFPVQSCLHHDAASNQMPPKERNGRHVVRIDGDNEDANGAREDDSQAPASKKGHPSHVHDELVQLHRSFLQVPLLLCTVVLDEGLHPRS